MGVFFELHELVQQNKRIYTLETAVKLFKYIVEHCIYECIFPNCIDFNSFHTTGNNIYESTLQLKHFISLKNF